MATTTYYVNTESDGLGDGTGGIDVLTGATSAYSTIQSALDARKGTIASGDTMVFECGGTIADGKALVSGWVISGELIIRGHEDYRHQGYWDTSKYRLEFADSVVGISNPNVTMEWVQINETSGGSRYTVSLNAGGTNFVIRDSILRDRSGGSGDYGLRNSASGNVYLAERCLFHGYPVAIADTSGDGGVGTLSKCTFVDCTSIYASAKSQTPKFTDCVFTGSSNGITSSIDPLSDYNVTDAADFGTGYTTNTNDLTGYAVEYLDAASDDYRIERNSPLATNGTNGTQRGAFYEPAPPQVDVTVGVTGGGESYLNILPTFTAQVVVEGNGTVSVEAKVTYNASVDVNGGGSVVVATKTTIPILVDVVVSGGGSVRVNAGTTSYGFLRYEYTQYITDTFEYSVRLYN